MRIHEDIASLLEDEGVATLGTDMFIGEIPDDVNNAFMLETISGQDPNVYMEIRSADINFWGRHSNAPDGYDELQQVWNRLHRRANYRTDNFHVFHSEVIGTIEDMGRDTNNRKLHKLRIRFTFRVLVAVS